MSDDPDQKRLATLQAECALRGFELVALPGGGAFIVRRWGLHRELDTLSEVERFLRRVSGIPLPAADAERGVNG